MPPWPDRPEDVAQRAISYWVWGDYRHAERDYLAAAALWRARGVFLFEGWALRCAWVCAERAAGRASELEQAQE